MEFEELILEKDRGVGVITLNRPEKLNALSLRIRGELLQALESVRCDEE